MIFKHSLLRKVSIITGALFICVCSYLLNVGLLIVNIYLVLWAIIWSFEVYVVKDNVLEKSFFSYKKVIPLESITHMRRVSPDKGEKEIRIGLVSYLISDGNKYIRVNRFIRNVNNQTLVDVLIDDYKIPITYEKDKLFISTKLDRQE